MTEQEYIDVTDLASCRIARKLISDCMFYKHEINLARKRYILAYINTIISTLESTEPLKEVK